ncbi:H-2 class II histocompatibility antigen, A-U alpha chain-like isoform X2 [Archocentrus centrarchus]|uniref:H-2 class II histocompatibility antigen, A-U alpha chain-like isoform X2 n=1 Tax=Archocentrus centrarchus TaxID=63155 RepID=UPI0011E9E088|nr:H-2 class II histocompatibility antigen, A-U alpha chain-like isoform X2 [Archocentrus centrarchus]
MKMKELLLFLSCVLSVSADVLHEELYIIGCSDSYGEVMFGLDGEEKRYADFNKQTEVDVLPPFAGPISCPGCYDIAVANLQVCKKNLQIAHKALKDFPLERDAPSAVMIYTRDEVEVGEKNTLICHVTGFYPAPVNVSWTKNGEKVTEGTSINVPYINKDGSFTQISRLQFTPQLGDIYSCAVEHLALTQPITKIYEVEASQSAPGVGPAVFCGVGLTVGLLGVAAGTFFLIKGNECS